MDNNPNLPLDVDKKDYVSLFDTIEHKICCKNVPATSLRLHFLRHTRGGTVPINQLVETLLTYITQFCLTAQRRRDLGEKERNRAFLEAKKLFRRHGSSGQPGELLVYFLIEAVLHAPQVLKKMTLTTNTNDERKGSDGVHMRWLENGDLEVLFAEAKLHRSFSAGLKSAFKSMTDFHNSNAKSLEINYFLNTFTLFDSKQQEEITAYVEGEKKEKYQEAHVCLVGYDWKEYECLDDERRECFLKEFRERYVKWATMSMKAELEAELYGFTHRYLKFEFFFLPFPSVSNFRQLFLENL